MGIKRSTRRVAEARLRTVTKALLDASTLCAIATVRRRGAYIHTAYFAWTPGYRLVWLSEPGGHRCSMSVRSGRGPSSPQRSDQDGS